MKTLSRLYRLALRSKRAFDVRSRVLDVAHAEAMVDQLEDRLFDTLQALSDARSTAEAMREQLKRAEARLAEADFVPAAPASSAAPLRAGMPGRRRIGQSPFWLRAQGAGQ